MPATRNVRSQNRKPYGRKAPKSSTGRTTPFEDAVPSLAIMKAIPTLASIKVSNDSGESERFKPNDSVFVAHGNTDRDARPLDGHSYWKSKIVSIHQFKSKPWVIVQWYYTSTQLKELGMDNDALEQMGNTELVMSNHQDVIPLDTIEARCKIVHWDDTDLLAEWLQVDSWYYRLEVVFKAGAKPRIQASPGINATCICRAMYSPALDLQHRCSTCSKWFHSACLEMVSEQRRDVGSKPLSKQLQTVPEVRGWDGGSGKPWETVGNVRKLSAFQRWLRKGQLPEGWREKMGEEFIEDMTSKKWDKYICPQCSHHI